MSSIRQDAWTHTEDSKLAATILGHISAGSTQLAGFAEAANLLSRTPAACGFRWNSSIRKQYAEELGEAKAQRKVLKMTRKKGIQIDPGEKKISDSEIQPISEAVLEQMIDFLGHLKNEWPDPSFLQSSEQIRSLQLENGALHESFKKLEQENKVLRKNYAALLRIVKMVDQARKNIADETVQQSVTSE
ncbi:hypothetical protein E4665_00515 [Sporolactobacillus shoreae]|uniref:RsfA family transcriptional regulator n=1 Tax=Sporolactobacillus shoreae TaxID=1465501 RepID=A0A4Z0GTW5_9BACL|nr:hypothetical protein [Sporolactobacillus shoreae]TGB00195.1 hypothetical protein E4665_00515 [Sporolactobacillus shoreae]